MKPPTKPSLASQLIKYADEVSNNAKVIATALETQNAEPEGIPHELDSVRLKLVEAAFQLLHLGHDAGTFLISLTVDYQAICAFKWLYLSGIPRLVPLNGTITYAKLAEASGVPEKTLKSALQLVMGSKLFEEPEIGAVGHSPVSRQIAVDKNFSHWAHYISGSIIPTAARHKEAMEKWPGSRKVNETAHNLAFCNDLPYFDYISQDPSRSIEFASTMRAISSTRVFNNSHLVESYDWTSLENGVIVDVGGSTGHATIALAEAFPKLNFVVQDLPDVTLDSVKNFHERKLHTSISSRISFQAHSFFDQQPVKAASVYLLRHILHDWPDKEAVQILNNIIPALGPNSRIIVSDIVLPAQGEMFPALEDRVMRLNDMLLHQFTNTSERTLEDWKKVFGLVGNGLQLRKIYRNPGSVLSLMELSHE